MNRTNKDIRDQFDFFTELLDESKTVLSPTIQLDSKKGNRKWLTGQSNVQHQTISDTIVFFVERSKRDSKYGIKLRCPSLTQEPFFRFDSDGPAHRNDFPDIPLEDQTVNTPHFNSYKANGKPFAYQNSTLKDTNEAIVIGSDINFGVSLFCMESKSMLLNGGFPTIIDKAPELDFEDNSDNTNFDLINFE